MSEETVTPQPLTHGRYLSLVIHLWVGGANLSLWPEEEGRLAGSAFWDRLQGLLPDRRERRLAYLLYQCGLQPTEIVRNSPQEQSDLQEVMELQSSISARLL